MTSDRNFSIVDRVSSVEPSSTTITADAGNDWASVLSMARDSRAARLYVGIIAADAYHSHRLKAKPSRC